MTIEQAIQTAIDGGWDDTNFAYGADRSNDPKVGAWYYGKDIFLDPLFWESLGKAIGWKKYTWTSWKGWDDYNTKYPTDDESYIPLSDNQFCQRHVTSTMMWHCFIDHLAEGKTVEDFFKTLTH